MGAFGKCNVQRLLESAALWWARGRHCFQIKLANDAGPRFREIQMRKSKILARLRAGEVARVVSTSHYLPFYPALAAQYGFDGVWVDTEHGNWDPSNAKAFMAYHHLADVDCLFRTSTREKTGLARIYEDGASGIMVPHVNDAAAATWLAECCKFPPLGDRGVDGSGLDGGFWVGKGPNYTQDANAETFTCLQIETLTAVATAEAIAAVPGVDMLFLGPGDLGVRVGCSGSLAEPAIWSALEKVVAACRKHGKFVGCPAGTGELAKKAVDLGVNLIAFGGEFMAIMEMMQRQAQVLDQVLGEDRLSKAGKSEAAAA